MKLRIFTAQMDYKGPHAHDTTIKTNKSCLVPNWDIVMDHKKGNIKDEEYTQEYLQILLRSLLRRKQEWFEILKKKEIVLTCFCNRGQFCHRYLAALFLQKFGAVWEGEIDTKNNKVINSNSYVQNLLTQETIRMVRLFEIPDITKEAKSHFTDLVVDPLKIHNAQSSICRTCSINRKVQLQTQKGTIEFKMIPQPGQEVELVNNPPLLPDWEENLGSKNVACCSHDVVGDKVEYHCPIFKQLVFGYKVGLTSRGTNLDPCKNCVEHVDNGGTCFGDRCPDGPFPIKEGCGLIRN